MAVELKTLVSEPDALTTLFFFYRSICIIDDGASRRRTRNTRFRARRADHSLFFLAMQKHLHHR